jgi:DNA end-binding protein Ku
MSRPIWTGSINFGLVSIPVEMQMAVHEKTIHFHMLTKDGSCRLRQKLYCPQTGKEYNFNETARGIEIAPDQYAIVEQSEINRLKPEKGRSMEIAQFVDLTAVDPIYYDRIYFLVPGKEAQKAYKLLLDAMLKSEKSAIARFVMRERQYLSLIRPDNNALMLHTLHYADEVETLDAAHLQTLKRVKISAAEMNMAGELIKSMTTPLDLNEYKDEFRAQLQELIDAKVKGKEIANAPDDHERPAPRTINLMEALKKSLVAGPAKSNERHAHRRSA